MIEIYSIATPSVDPRTLKKLPQVIFTLKTIELDDVQGLCHP